MSHSRVLTHLSDSGHTPRTARIVRTRIKGRNPVGEGIADGRRRTLIGGVRGRHQACRAVLLRSPADGRRGPGGSGREHRRAARAARKVWRSRWPTRDIRAGDAVDCGRLPHRRVRMPARLLATLVVGATSAVPGGTRDRGDRRRASSSLATPFAPRAAPGGLRAMSIPIDPSACRRRPTRLR